MSGVLSAPYRTFRGVPRCSRGAIGKRAAGLNIVKPGLGAYVGGCVLSVPLRSCSVGSPPAAAPINCIRCSPRTTATATRPGPSAGPAKPPAAWPMARSGKDASVPWQNPNTGAGGNITPLATSYNEGGVPCRDFLASYAHGGSEDWLQGAACRTSQGNWEVKSLKPLKRS